MAIKNNGSGKLAGGLMGLVLVAVLEPESWDEWLRAPVGLARQLITLAPAAVFQAEPDPGKRAGSQEGTRSLF